ncbi:hypothetical protein MMC15_001897 [Xylographa vitiligo]|nr:hypothetical protein [Xylographa vitiligo]
MSDTPMVSHGRGGAANIRKDNTPYVDADIIREGPVGDQGDGAYSAGRGGAANIESPWAAGSRTGSVHDIDVIPEQAFRRESQVDTHTGRGGAANVHHVGQTTMPVGQQDHHIERGGEGNVQHSGGKHEGALSTLKQMFSSKKK